MHLFSIVVEVRPDGTGKTLQVPGLMDSAGSVLMPLVRYLQHLLMSGRSQTQLSKIREAVRLYAEYSICNQPPPGFGQGKTGSVQEVRYWEHFQHFRYALVVGSFGVDGLDPTGLCWTGSGVKKANNVVRLLTEFFVWLDEHDGGDRAARLNPLVTGTNYEWLCAASRYEHSRNRALLGHTWAKPEDKKFEHRSLDSGRGKKPAVSDVKRISKSQFDGLLARGFDVNSENGLRDAMIALLMNKGGLRLSEVLHLWVLDIVDDPASPGSALVRVLHPTEANCRLEYRGRKYTKRSDYLLSVYGLKDRCTLVKKDAQHLGWKSRFTVLEIYWAEPWWGNVFLHLWRRYLQLTAGKRARHPYAFVDSTDGEPLTADAYGKAYSRAIYRAGLVPPGEWDMKNSGLTPHGNRHAYGHRLKNEYELSRQIVQKALHHASIESQLIYTVRSRSEIASEIEKARLRRSQRELAEMKEDLPVLREQLREKSPEGDDPAEWRVNLPKAFSTLLEAY